MIRLLPGDCREVLATLPASSVHCVVTSPPYYGLRDYGTAQWAGGDAACDHTGVRRNHNGEKQGTSAGTSRDPVSRSCLLCGAARVDRQIGLEPTPDAYLAEMAAVFREVKRVLHPTGSVFCNMGDSYSDKQLLMMPARLALALQADGWWLRSDCIWHKPNPMPESVTDRPTSAHEHVFLLAKSARYYYDADAVREEHTNGASWIGRPPTQTSKGNADRADNGGRAVSGNESGRNCRNVWTIATAPYSEAHFATFPPALAERCIRAGTKPGDTVLDPFAGAGTTLLVADRLQRDAIGIELNPAYTKMAMARCRDDAPLFASPPPAEDPEEARQMALFMEPEYGA